MHYTYFNETKNYMAKFILKIYIEEIYFFDFYYNLI